MADRILRPGTVLGGTYLIESRIGSGGGLVFAPASFQKTLGDVPKIFPREKHLTHMTDFFKAEGASTGRVTSG